MSKPNQLFLLADHIKLSLLERQRAKSLNLDDDSQEGHISRSLDQFRDGLEALQEEQRRQTESGDASGAQSIADALPALQKQFSDLTSQFHGFPTPETTSTLTQPNDPSLSPDFAHAQSATAATAGPPRKTTLRSPSSSSTIPKTVRFTDSAPSPSAADPALTAELFGPYRDEPMQIGDELDSHVAMLDDVDAATDRHQGRLDRARRNLNKVARSAGESKQMMTIIALIIILVLLIAVLK
ncbi:Phosphatidylinositide phosphatase SAC2 [Verticillium dahliae VDG2]|nr:Phosphatidylinositide phosphatase SAC2 [Verticillium dahliae VDG2]